MASLFPANGRGLDTCPHLAGLGFGLQLLAWQDFCDIQMQITSCAVQRANYQFVSGRDRFLSPTQRAQRAHHTC